MILSMDEMPLLAMLKGRMSWLSARQNVLAQNVANADTPGFTARDLKPINFEDMLHKSANPGGASGGLGATDPRHIALSQGGDTSFTDAALTQSSGNSVSLEQEMIRVADTQAEYQAASNLYAKAIDMMKVAIGR